AYVADFIGTSNFWAAEAAEGRVALPDGQSVETALQGPVQVMARPHNLRLGPPENGCWTGRVSFRRNVGPLIEYHVETAAGETIRVAAMRQDRARPVSDRAEVSIAVIDPAGCAVYPG
ncbi:MAG: TOBE domain-containing protein, partial [Pseudomonadota bacterium]